MVRKSKKVKSKTAVGKDFEKDFFDSFPNDFHVERVRDSNGFTKNKKDEFVRMAGLVNECDFNAYRFPFYFKIECKSTQNKTSLPFSMLKIHQVNKLNDSFKMKGIVAGFTFNFRELKETYFIEADKIYNFYHNADRKSFPIKWVRDNGVPLHEYSDEKERRRFDLTEMIEIEMEEIA